MKKIWFVSAQAPSRKKQINSQQLTLIREARKILSGTNLAAKLARRAKRMMREPPEPGTPVQVT